MAFFDLPPDGELTPEVRQMLEEQRRLGGLEKVSDTWRTFGRSAKIIEGRFGAYQALNVSCRFPWGAKNLAVMLIAHAKRCRTCFAASRSNLDKLGFDEAALDGICANPEVLPLKDRDRAFVHYTLKIATGSADLEAKDFREMAERGFSRDEIQEIIAFAAYWTMNMVFSQAGLAGLSED